MHWWCADTGKKVQANKISELTGKNAQITTITYTERFRLYIIFTSDFKIYYFNEMLYLVWQSEMSQIRQINFAYCHDKSSKIVLANTDGACVCNFNY